MAPSLPGDVSAYSEPRSALLDPASMFSFLASTARKILEEKDIHEVLRAICEEACQFFGADRAMISRIQMNAPPYREVLYNHGLPEDFIEAFRRSTVFPALVEELHQSGAPRVIPDIQLESRVFSAEAVRASGHRTVIIIPLRVQGELFGRLYLYHLSIHEYSPEDISLAGALGDMASLAIEKARLVESLKSRITEQDSLQRSLRHVANGNEIAEIVQAVLDESESVMGTDRCVLGLHEPGRDKIEQYFGRGLSRGFAEDLRRLPEPFPLCRAYISDPGFHEPTLIADVSENSTIKEIQLREGHKSMAVFPLRGEGKNFGALFYYWTTRREFDVRIVSLGQSFADQVAVAIQKTRLLEQSREDTSRQESIGRIAKAVGSTLVPEKLFPAIVREIRQAVPCSRCAIAEMSREKGRVRWHQESDIEIRYLDKFEAMENWWVRDVYERRRVVNVPDLREISNPRTAELVRAGFRSHLSIPILRDGECIAHLSLMSDRVGAFSEEQAAFLTEVATHLGPAIRNALLYHAAETRARQLEITEAIGRAIGSTLEPEELFQTIVREIGKHVPHDRCVIASAIGDGGEYQYWHVESKVEVPPAPEADHPLKPLLMSVYETKKPAYCPDAKNSAYADSPLALSGLQSFLVIPVVQEGNCIAHIFLSSEEKDAFSEMQINLLVSVANHLASAFRNSALYRESTDRASRLAILDDLNHQIAKNLDLSDVLNSIVRSTVELLQTDAAMILLTDEKSGDLVSRARYSTIPGFDPEEMVFRAGEGIAGKVVKSGRPIAVADVQSDPEWLRPGWAREYGFHSFLGQPLLLGGKVVGVINSLSRKKDFFVPENIAFLASLASQAAVAIENARLYRETEERGRHLGTLVEVGQQISRGLDLSSAIRSIAETAATLFEGDANFRLLEGEHLVLVARTAGLRDQPIRERVRIGVPISGLVAKTGRPMITSDPENDPRLPPELREVIWKGRSAALMVVPARIGDSVVGTLGIYREKGYEFGEDGVFLAESLADQAAIAIENSRLHEEARRSRDFFQSVVDDNADAIIVTDKEHRVICWNRAAENLFGYTEEEAFSRSLVDLIVPEDQRNAWNTKYKEQVSDLVSVGKFHLPEAVRRRKDGTEISVEITVSPVKNDRGEIVAFCSFNKDLSLRKRAEEVLIEAKVSAEKANRAKSEFLSNVSHELRSPLNSVIGFSELLIQRCTDEQALRFLPKIRDAGKYLSSLIDDLRDLDRIDNAKMRLDRHDVDINELVENFLEYWNANLKEGYSVALSLDAGCGSALCDPVRIRQVLNNLLDNAVKFSPAPGRIRVTTQSKPSEIWISVEDNGIGLGPGEREIIFDRFRQIESGNPRSSSGMGIGLYLVRQLLAMHDGHIWVESEKDSGSAFTFALPKGKNREETGSYAADARGEDEEPWDGRRVLLIDDLEMFHMYVSMLMSSAAEVYSAYNGEEGIEMARRLRPDIILMDLRMPVMNGYEAIERLKTDPETRDMPIIAVTAQAMGEDRERCFQAGADGYVTKPIDRKFLTREVGRLLRKNP